ncbi:rhamnan synthesis F family protein [Halomonas ramblicola]|uniref:rhamnan synthesis F family protein n=1 Tax=Halomonas ramblicola TaxID=747349 RepID=UPI0025B39B3A|nr:rhamnan synthesis F family protein [Halomonas ramblicola]MDN3522089.1 rhamnan synthesis F family protein [Halomonas ramblicola]
MDVLKKANRLFRERRYVEARKNYKKLMKGNSNIQGIANFNIKLCEKKLGQEVAFNKKEDSEKREINVASGCITSEVDMHGNQINLYPKPSYQEVGYRLDREREGAFVYLPYGEGACNIHDVRKKFSVAIHIHIFYESLIDEFLSFLENIEFPFSVYVSVVDQKLKLLVENKFQTRLSNANIKVKVFSNRGRDISHFVSGFAKQLLDHDIVAHFHSKRSPHNFTKSDWRRQLLVPLLGSPDTINKIIDIFSESPNVGMIFPIYHYSLRGQISWGTNFGISKRVANKLGFDVEEQNMALFPAGSMFWARTNALKSLLEAGFAYEDFPEESSQIDGTLAHAIERLLGSVVHDNWYQLLQVDSDKHYNLIKYYPAKYPYYEKPGFLKKVEDYQKNKKNNNKVVVFTALSGGYEELPRPQHLNPNYDYVAFCDEPMDSHGVWQLRPMEFWHPDKVRMARRIKTNPHVYLKDYDLAIWIDANVVIENDISQYVNEFISSSSCVAGIPHPIRNCVYHEAQSVMETKKDVADRVGRQIKKYRKEQYPEYNGLIETNLMMIKIDSPDARKFLDRWWSEICKFSHRDQLSVNYALWKESLDWYAIMKDRISLRDSFDFAYLGHGRNSGYVKSKDTGNPIEIRHPFEHAKSNQIHTSPEINKIGIDIIVCVHNALDEVKACLKSIVESRRNIDKLIVVDDCSEENTQAYLDEFLKQYSWATLHRNTGQAQGYCRAANKGMSLSKSKYFLLLNSDTVITRKAIENMLKVAEQSEKNGIVGPMSNAASLQSIPDIKNTATQTAVNVLPKNISVTEMNNLCERWAYPGIYPTVPLVHGFCQLIKKSVYEEIGGFDEQSFPEGYGEENDFCLRAADAGYDLKVSTNSFVFHKKSASYSNSERRARLMKSGSEKLKKKHGEDRLAQSIKIMEGHFLLGRMREQANLFFSDSQG